MPLPLHPLLPFPPLLSSPHPQTGGRQQTKVEVRTRSFPPLQQKNRDTCIQLFPFAPVRCGPGGGSLDGKSMGAAAPSWYHGTTRAGSDGGQRWSSPTRLGAGGGLPNMVRVAAVAQSKFSEEAGL